MILNFKNGLLNLRDPLHPVLMPHSPEYLFPVQIPVNYDPDATCPEWDKQIAASFPADCVEAETAYEIIAFLCCLDRSIQKAILLLGDGGTGKSTFLTALIAFLGRRNVSAMTLHKIEEDRFAAASLYGKLANVCADLPSRHLETVAMFKEIVAGDEISGERKFHPEFIFRPYCRLLFSANRPPLSGDADNGFFDRWYILPFNRVYRGTDKEVSRKELDAKLARPSELSGVLNRALKVLPAILKRHGLTVTGSMADGHKEFVERTNPVSVWLERATIDADLIPCATLLRAYNQYARSSGHRELTRTAFGNALHATRPSVEVKQRIVDGNLQWCWPAPQVPTIQK